MAGFERAIEARQDNSRGAGGDDIAVQPIAAPDRPNSSTIRDHGDALFRSGTATRWLSQYDGADAQRERAGLADRLFQFGEYVAGARGGATKRDRSAAGAGSKPVASDAAVVDRKLFAGRLGRRLRRAARLVELRDVLAPGVCPLGRRRFRPDGAQPDA